MSEYVKIGQITGTHGLKGEVRVYPLTENEKRFSELKKIRATGIGQELEVERVWKNKNMIIMKFVGYHTIEQVERLKGKYLLIEKEELPKLEDGEYYIFDLVGLEVYTEENVFVGVLTEVLQPGANDVYVVENGNVTNYIPAIKDVVMKVSLEQKKMIIRPMEGMLSEN